MTKKHNAKHARGRSNYKERLAARGESKTPMMSDPMLEDNKRASAKR